MKGLLKANIRKSFKIVAEDNPKIAPELISVDNDQAGPSRSPNIIEEMMKVAAQPIPWFYKDGDELRSPQQPFFGLYALRNILRGIFMSVRFIQAGDLLYKNHFLASSVFSYYTASFHLLPSFLAANSRVIIDQVSCGPVKIVNRKNSSEGQFCSLDHSPSVVIAILTKKNTWKFEPRPRSHSRRWKELESVFRELDFDIPEFLRAFFSYILQYGPHSSEPSETETIVQKGLKRLADVRHESIYSGYGFDDYVHDGLINRDLNTSYGIDFKSKAYRDFALGLLRYALDEAFDAKTIIHPEHWLQEQILIMASMNTPPFELVEIKVDDNDEITELLKRVFAWFERVKSR